MKCPLCNAPTEVKETRPRKTMVMRRRLCFNLHKFITHESAVTPPQLKDANAKRKKAHEPGG